MVIRPTSLLTPLVVTALCTAGAVAPANAAGPTGGCPSGFRIFSVAALAAEGYEMPGRIDDSSSGVLSYGRPGNDNGLVCGVKLGRGLTTSWGGPIYNFIDDQLPAGG